MTRHQLRYAEACCAFFLTLARPHRTRKGFCYLLLARPMLTIPPLLLLAIATFHDLRARTIPDWIAATLSVWALATTVWSASGTSWIGLAAGLSLGFGLGAAAFWLGAFGGGDVKLIAALGAVLGPHGLLGMLFWTALAGGLLALVAKWRGHRDLAYVPAIAAGFLIYTLRGGV
ncbi:MAG TPA: prepilin peptidase [Pirellulales bacterium]|nr:prepilin peptidase [Pirellulales bacterium]